MKKKNSLDFNKLEREMRWNEIIKRVIDLFCKLTRKENSKIIKYPLDDSNSTASVFNFQNSQSFFLLIPRFLFARFV